MQGYLFSDWPFSLHRLLTHSYSSVPLEQYELCSWRIADQRQYEYKDAFARSLARTKEENVPLEPSSRAFFEGKTIAVIEDDHMTRMALQYILESWGCRVLAGHTGDIVITTINEEALKPDLILTDYRLGPGLTGIDAAQQLRKHAGRKVPVIILSGDDSLYRHERILEEGWTVMEKPCPPVRLQISIAEALSHPCA